MTKFKTLGNLRIMIDKGKFIEFKDGFYETDKPDEIELLNKKPGIYIVEDEKTDTKKK